ncbi:hypothetical protein HYU14_00220 [Candidatus Woesearchaeota archaeon]|nr:hypothetical protein [Candidatus Woesearchaeota archaeon]
MQQQIPYLQVKPDMQSSDVLQEIQEGCVARVFGIQPDLRAHVYFVSLPGQVYHFPLPRARIPSFHEAPPIGHLSMSEERSDISNLIAELDNAPPAFIIGPLKYVNILRRILGGKAVGLRVVEETAETFPRHIHSRTEIGEELNVR